MEGVVSKPAKTYQEQLDLLKSRGLNVPDEAFALHALIHHNYYRLSAYRFSYTVAGNRDLFRQGTTFQHIWDLYHFDRTLRQLVLEGCKRVEISTRARWAYELGHRLGPTAYSDPQHYSKPSIHATTLAKLDEEMQRSQEVFINHHRRHLQMPWPPAWVVSEVASFGSISNLLSQLKDPSIRQSVADTYQLDEKTFCSLFHHLSVLRNTAAHHSRLWNRKFVVTFQLPRKKPPHLFPNFEHLLNASGNPRNRCIYNSLVLLVHLIEIIEPQSTWPRRLAAHLDSLDPTLQPEMELPADWKSRPLWQALLP